MIHHRQLSHPNIIKFLGVCPSSNEEFHPLAIVLPFLPAKVQAYLQVANPQTWLKFVSDSFCLR